MIMLRCWPALLALTWCSSTWAVGNYPGDAVRVNDVTISYQRFNGFYTEYRNSRGVAVGARGDQLPLLTRLRREAMERMIEQELVGQAARQAGIEVDAEDVDAAVEELRALFNNVRAYDDRLESEGFTEESYRRHVEQMIAAKIYLDRVRMNASDVSDHELEAYYRDNERRFTFPEQVRVRHILLTWKPMGTQDDRAAIREQMLPILERARRGEDFASLAREFSDDYATKELGGDTGFFQRGEMMPAFEEAAFALKPGEISDRVETAFGVHIIRLEERREPYLVKLDEIREKLRDYIRDERSEQAVRDEIERLRADANIKVLIPLGASE